MLWTNFLNSRGQQRILPIIINYYKNCAEDVTVLALFAAEEGVEGARRSAVRIDEEQSGQERMLSKQ